MIKLMNKRSLLSGLLAVGLLATGLVASAAGTVKAWQPRDAKGATLLFSTVSDNGKWAVSTSPGDEMVDNPMPSGGCLMDLTTQQLYSVAAGRTGVGSVDDVTDDGSIVVGQTDGRPAFWTRATGEWTNLPMPKGYDGGEVLYVTPDGSRALGVALKSSDLYAACPVMYDMATRTIIDTPNLPFIGQNKYTYTQNAPHGLAADGKTFIGMVAESYLGDFELGEPTETGAVMWAYIYDVEKGTYKAIGWDIDDYENFKPQYPGSNFIDGITMSPNGKWACGALRLVDQQLGDIVVPFRYETAADKFEVYFEGESTTDMAAMAVDDNGTLYTAQPWENPYPTGLVRSGKYFYSFELVWRQAFNFNLVSALGDIGDVSGRVMSVSGDGLTFAMKNGSDYGYMLQVSERMDDAASTVDLLGTWRAEPARGSSMAQMKTVTLTFDRDIELIGNPRHITLFDDATGEPMLQALRSSQVVDKRKLSIGFETTPLAADGSYTLNVPEGLISIAGDAATTNREINIAYKGRANTAVKLLATYPADNTPQASLNSSDSPILLTYDGTVAINPDAAPVYLYEEGYREPKATLLAAESSLGADRVVLFPASAVYLYEGSDYRVEIPEGFVTDVSGAGPSAAVTLHFKGAYVRSVSADDTTLFSADGSVASYTLFIPFDGDQNQPAAEPASWGMTSATPWWGVTDESGDRAFASHSMYTPAGTSNDWLMTPQLYIPDDKVTLSFDAQGYRNNKQDKLEVVIWACEDGFNTLDAELADRILTEGEIVFSEVVTPGKSESELAGDWSHYFIPLAQWEKKSIYIAFLNRNTDQSAVFLDNVLVQREMDFTTSFRNARRVVNAADIAISGRITISSETKTFSSASFRLLDGEGTELEALAPQTGSFKRGDNIEFTFTKPLALELGEVNPFSVEVTLDGVRTLVSDAVSCLTFEPVRRVTVEEFSGLRCSNCPLGFIAMEKLEKTWPGLIVPVVLRCYMNDPVGQGVTDYAEYLGGNAAPAARINRGEEWILPGASLGNRYYFTAAESGLGADAATLWYDVVAAELDNPAEASVEFSVNHSKSRKELSIPIEVTYALNATGRSLRLFGVVLEDKVPVSQLNGFASLSNPELAPWSGGGSLVELEMDDIARSTIGLTFNGTADLLPADLVAGQTYQAKLTTPVPANVPAEKVNDIKVAVMLIDGATGAVVNANIARIGGHTGALDTLEAGDAASLVISRDGDNATAVGNGAVTIEAFTPAGILAARAHGNGSASVSLAPGLNIVRATAADGSTAVAKFFR